MSSPIVFDFDDVIEMISTIQTMEKSKDNILSFVSALKTKLKSNPNLGNYGHEKQHGECFDQLCEKCGIVGQIWVAIIENSLDVLVQVLIFILDLLPIPGNIKNMILGLVLNSVLLFLNAFNGFESLVSIRFFECFGKCECRNLSIKNLCLAVFLTFLSIVAILVGFTPAVGIIIEIYDKIFEFILEPAGEKLSCISLLEECF